MRKPEEGTRGASARSAAPHQAAGANRTAQQGASTGRTTRQAAGAARATRQEAGATRTTRPEAGATRTRASHFTNSAADGQRARAQAAPGRTAAAPGRTAAAPMGKAVPAYDPHMDLEGMRGREAAGKAPRRRHGRGAAIAVGAVCAVYLAGCALWSNVYMPNTTVNGKAVSLKTPAAEASDLNDALDSYQLAISGDNVSLSLKGSDIDLKYDTSSYATDTMSKINVWTWPVTIFTGNNVTTKVDMDYDKDKLASLVSAAVKTANSSATQPTNATASYSESSGKFVVTKEKVGTAVDESAVLKAVKSALSTGTTTLALGDDQLQQPTVTSTSKKLKTAVETANKYLAATQTLTANSKTVATVDAKTIAKWVTVGDDLSVSLNTDAIKEWASGDLAKSLNNVGTTRTYTRADGKQVSVSGGTYGWSVNTDSLASTLASNIEAAKAATFDVPWSTKAEQWNPGGADWGTRYIDVDLSEQHARFYDNGSIIWESDFVSGDPTEDHATDTGVYTINSNKGTNQTLKGLDENHDGEPDYTSHVTYWMPFVGNLVAFHDASWRSTFGGTIYQGNGSHGCINLPTSAAQKLYDLTKVGDVVVVHS